MTQQPNDLQQARLAKRQILLEAGLSPYPSAGRGYVDHSLSEVRALPAARAIEPEANRSLMEIVRVAGRVIFFRSSGGISFARIRSGEGTELQLAFSKREVGEESFGELKTLLDLGDFIRVEGEVKFSSTLELSVFVTSWEIAAKALHPPPFEHGDLSEENRVRKPYLNLMVNQEARNIVRGRAAVLRAIRRTLDDYDYIEVETPILQLTNGGANARPFRTHLNALGQDMNLRIALELSLKKALVGGIDRVYEISKNFRNEGIDSSHSPEFTMLEAYHAYGDMEMMKVLFDTLMVNVANDPTIFKHLGGTQLTLANGEVVELTDAIPQATVSQLVSDAIGVEVNIDTNVLALVNLAEKHQVHLGENLDAGQILVQFYEQLVESNLMQPIFVEGFPTSVRPLARPRDDDPRIALAFDFVVGGSELGSAYTELNDPVVQRERLLEQSLLAAGGDAEAMELDESFLDALEYGCPPAGGMGLGIDRLMMLFYGVGIRETQLFPLLRPEQ